MNDDLFGPIAAGAVILFFMGVFVGMGVAYSGADSKWCARMKDTTWGECVSNGEQVKVIEDVQ